MKKKKKKICVISEIQKDWEIWVSIFAFILMICGFVFLMTSCTEEMIDKPVKSGSGKVVAIRFALGDIMYNGDEVVMRTSPLAPLQKRGEEETVVVSLGDGLSMVATLEVDEQVRMRATSSGLKEGTKLRIVAYEDGDDYRGHVDYTVGSDGSLVGEPMNVYAGDYRFVAYAYNVHSDLLPPHSETIQDIDVKNDLVWGCFPENKKTEYIGNQTNDIRITLTHSFSQVSFEASTKLMPDPVPRIAKMANVSVSGTKAHLTVKNGTFAANDDVVAYAFPKSSIFATSTPEAMSSSIMVFTGGQKSTYLKIDTLILNVSNVNKTITNLSAAFDKELKSGVSYRFKINFRRDMGIEEEKKDGIGGRPPGNIHLFVGAFWKSNQTGERLIRIQRPTDYAASNPYDYPGFGEWKATVISGADWIVLDTQMTTDRNVGWRTDVAPNPNESLVHTGNDANFDAEHAVNSTATTVFGAWYLPGDPNIRPGENADSEIYFRIGLRSKYIPTLDRPARYGVVLISYHNSNPNMRYSTNNDDYRYQSRIWIRQGEGDDYVFSNSDPVNSGGLNIRTAAKRFSPYNLTAQTLDEAVMTQAEASNPYTQGNRSTFAEYPSQMGAFFQWAAWASEGRIRYAWNPYTTTVSTWDPNFGGMYWGVNKDLYETCPPGYHRPSDGLIDDYEPTPQTSIAHSEIRQSLFAEPKVGISNGIGASSAGNSVWGYYADGFFDRHQIENQATVSSGNRYIAHIGRLFYNPNPASNRYGASLFFPAGGYRDKVEKGNLVKSGKEAEYMTASATSPDEGVYMHIFGGHGSNQHAGLWSGSKAFGFAVRCVKTN